MVLLLQLHSFSFLKPQAEKVGKPKAGKPNAEQMEAYEEKKKAKAAYPYPFPDSIEAFVYFLPFLYHRGRLKL
jgi:hypothetical protein